MKNYEESKMATLEHVNLTVRNPQATAKMLCRLFDWEVRWEGEAMDSGYTLHVGNADGYLAVYATGQPEPLDATDSHRKTGLNHIGIEVADIRACEARVIEAGYTTFNHASYDPGERFYFLDQNSIEFEIICYG